MRKMVVFWLLVFSVNLVLADVIGDLEKEIGKTRGKERIALLAQVSKLLVSSDPQKAIDYSKQALALLETDKDDKLKIGFLDHLSQAYYFLGDPVQATDYGKKSLELAKKIASPRAQAIALNILSIILNRQGDYVQARNYAQQSYRIFAEIGEKKLSAVALNNIGISFDMQGRYEKALEYYLKSLKLKEELGDKPLIASSLNNIGVIQMLLGNKQAALGYYRRALKIRQELGDQRGIASLYNNIGNIYHDLKDREKTLEYYRKSLELDSKLNNLSGISSTLFNIGLVYEESNDLPKALDHYRQSLTIRQKLQEKAGIGETLIQIGKVSQGQGRFKEAVTTINQGLALCREAGAKDKLSTGYLVLSSAFEGMKDFRSALENYKNYKNIADQLMDADTRKKITEIQGQYEADKKEQEIVILKKNNEIQRLMLNRQRLIRNFMIVALLSILLLSVQLLRKYRYLFAFWKKKNYIGHYKILEQMGTGGMGTVFRAADVLNANATLAIKIMREEFFSDEIQKKRFKQEASLIDQLVHPHIVKITERGESGSNLYIAMELLEGPTLAEMMKNEKKLDIAIALHIMVQIADALDTIHAANIIHRDLKPENIILVNREGDPYFVKLLDFGLATTQYLSRLTETGMVVGTIFYLSPEQLTVGQLSPASDIFALGVIYYEMLTGEKPFSGESAVEVMKQIVDKEILPPDVFRPDIDRTLSNLVRYMLRKNPAHRPDAGTVFNILREINR